MNSYLWANRFIREDGSKAPLMNRHFTLRADMLEKPRVRRRINREYWRDRRRQLGRRLLIVACITLAVGMLLKWLVFSVVTVRGNGMAQVLRGGDIVLCEHKLPLPGNDILPVEKGDLALIYYTDDIARHRIIRRVIGTGGDKVFVTMEGRVTVNDVELEEPYAHYRNVDPSENPGSGLIPNPFAANQRNAPRISTEMRYDETIFPLTVPEGMLLVLADDRETFDDSRSRAIGLVDARNVLGVVDGIIWPAHRAALLTTLELPDVQQLAQDVLLWLMPMSASTGDGEALN